MSLERDFGPYELKEELGKGGMAKVYLAVQKALQRPVALKLLFSHLAEDDKVVQRFVREARTASELHHENIVQIIDCGRIDDVAFICMEFVEGLDLQKWLKSHGAPPVEIALLMIRDLCRGLEHAHSRRITHRDIKPANIMLTPEGVIKIMDFGLARTGGEASEALTLVGAVLGTPAYMSPEQASGEKVDERSDIFSAGVVAYELLGGRRPFDGDSYAKVLSAVLTADPTDIQRINPLVTDEVARILRGMLTKDASRRTQTIQQVRQELEAVIHEMGLLRSREMLRDYTLDPQATAQKWHTKRLSRHLDQGKYFEAMGQARIEDALSEYRRALFLDPENEAAREHIRALEHERDHSVALEAAASAAAAAGAAQAAAPATAAPAAAKGGSTNRGVLMGVLGTVVVLALGFGATKLLGPKSPGAPGAADSTAVAGAPADSAAVAAPVAAAVPAATTTDTMAALATVCSLYVSVSPRADQVLVNGKSAAGKDVAFAYAWPGGRYKIEAVAAGFTTALATGRGKVGEVKHVTMTLAPAPVVDPAAAAAAAAQATPGVPGGNIPLHVEVTPPCDIYLAGVLRAQNATTLDIAMPEGKYEVAFVHPDFVKVRRDVQFRSDKPTKPLKVDLTAGEGGISVRGGKAGLKIFIDGRSSGVTTPGVVRGIKPGRRNVELRESDGVTVVSAQSVVVGNSPGNQVVQF
ncbi:MAG: serine/threonine protein kinase [Candidatus Eisenbacteria bacterium]|uniref:non-specific serine/threonine protein kinase n=1 Tax=Eiseniibacteriota bacterium TaxID=2212470 RepID=A0A933S996_UNCEI|nr:serine/threonine protein kinase [Candidatus Eisenbacteria bacterium]